MKSNSLGIHPSSGKHGNANTRKVNSIVTAQHYPHNAAVAFAREQFVPISVLAKLR